jgi:hypothetical protein
MHRRMGYSPNSPFNREMMNHWNILEVATSASHGLKIQDTRLRRKTWIKPPWIQDSRSRGFGFKMFFLDLESWILNPERLGSSFSRPVRWRLLGFM